MSHLTPPLDVGPARVVPQPAGDREGWPDHEPDMGRTGNPVNWCPRCRLEADAHANTTGPYIVPIPAPVPTDQQEAAREKLIARDASSAVRTYLWDTYEIRADDIHIRTLIRKAMCTHPLRRED